MEKGEEIMEERYSVEDIHKIYNETRDDNEVL